MAKKIVAGNWKMNLTLNEGVELINQIENAEKAADVEVMTFVPSLFVQSIASNAKDVKVGVQNFNPNDNGAYTGEVSIGQVKSVAAQIGLIGHSERRMLFNETNEFLKEKVNAALQNDFNFIFCCGEPLEVREAGEENIFVKAQLIDSLFHLSKEQMNGAIIAYEPVWAIGTGKTASSQQAEEMHANIRQWLTESYDVETANSVSILYGGSCNPTNANELFACPNVDGGLIGGASLKTLDFTAIINAF